MTIAIAARRTKSFIEVILPEAVGGGTAKRSTKRDYRALVMGRGLSAAYRANLSADNTAHHTKNYAFSTQTYDERVRQWGQHGLTVDRVKHERELAEFVARYPTLAAYLDAMRQREAQRLAFAEANSAEWSVLSWHGSVAAAVRAAGKGNSHPYWGSAELQIVEFGSLLDPGA